jgi:hypothetical protein
MFRRVLAKYFIWLDVVAATQYCGCFLVQNLTLFSEASLSLQLLHSAATPVSF